MARLVIPNNQMGDLMYNALTKTQNILNPAYGLVEVGKDDNIIINGGLTFTKRYQEGLGTWETVTSNTFAATPTGLDQEDNVIMNLQSRLAHSQADYDKYHTGEEELDMTFKKQIAQSAVLNIQDNLAASIKGAFLAADATAFKTDISGDTPAYPTYDTIVDVIAAAYPDKAEDVIKAIIVHADIYASILKDTATTWSDNPFGAEIALSGKIPMLAGLAVIKNSTIGYKTGTGASATYMSYLVGANALTVDYQRNVLIETDRAVLTGMTTVVANQSFFCGIKNASWKGSTTSVPTLAALATGTNWEFNEFNTQDVGVHEIKSLKV